MPADGLAGLGALCPGRAAVEGTGLCPFALHPLPCPFAPRLAPPVVPLRGFSGGDWLRRLAMEEIVWLRV